MLQLLLHTNIPFMKYRRIAYALSGALMLATALWLLINGGPRLSVDFTGGTVLHFRTSEALPVEGVREALQEAGLRGFELQQLIGEAGDEFLVRTSAAGTEEAPHLLLQRAIPTHFPDATVELRRMENVGPKVGSELREKAIWAVLGSLGGILVYVGLRYEFKFAFGAIVALFQDVFVTVGVLCFAGREISLTEIAALLTIAGFSINDTIVIFDRIRERVKKGVLEHRSRIIDVAVNETLSRTLITSLTVLFTALSLLFFGGEPLRGFSIAMVAGILLGSYSTVYLASGLALDTWVWLGGEREGRDQWKTPMSS